MLQVVEGDLLKQDVEAIVNPWNRNFIPYWLLWPQGVSGAIRKQGGAEPFRQLARHGLLPLGGAVVTSAGYLPFRGIIHVAGLSVFWMSGEKAIRLSTANALVAAEGRFSSVAFPLIGAGTGGVKPDLAEAYMREEIEKSSYAGEVRIVRYKPLAPTCRSPVAPPVTSPVSPKTPGKGKNRIDDCIASINHFLTHSNCSDFVLDRYDGCRLTLLGSFDYMYYHDIAIGFLDVSRISMDTFFLVDNSNDVFSVSPAKGEDGYVVTVLASDGRRYEVTCEEMDVAIGQVKYFNDAGERIDWRETAQSPAGRSRQ